MADSIGVLELSFCFVKSYRVGIVTMTFSSECVIFCAVIHSVVEDVGASGRWDLSLYGSAPWVVAFCWYFGGGALLRGQETIFSSCLRKL